MIIRFFKKFWAHKNAAYIAGLVILAAFLCFFRLGRLTFSFDEVTTIIISKSWQDMIHLMRVEEGNMWIYFFIMHFVLKLGDNELILRSISALCGVLTAIVFYVLASEIMETKNARIATLLFIMNVYFLFYAQIARGYSMALLFTTLSSLFFYRFAKDTNKTIYAVLYGVASVLAIYSSLLTD